MRSASSVSASVSYRDFPSIAPAAISPKTSRRTPGRAPRPDGPSRDRRRRRHARRRGSLRRRRLGIEKTLDSRPRSTPPREAFTFRFWSGFRHALGSCDRSVLATVCAFRIASMSSPKNSASSISSRRIFFAGGAFDADDEPERERGAFAGNPPFSPLSAGVVEQRAADPSNRANPAPALAAARPPPLPRALLRLHLRARRRRLPVRTDARAQRAPRRAPARMSVAIPGNARAPPTPPTIAAPRPSALLPICDVAVGRFSLLRVRGGPSIARRDAA